MKNKIKELEEKLLRKEQECEELKEANEEKNELLIKLGCPTIATARMKAFTLKQQLDQLKAEVKSKTEYIQEQRDIINQYSKEIEMYKKCQGKRASKREEELKAENEELKKRVKGEIHLGNKYKEDFVEQFNEADKLKAILAEIKEIVQFSNRPYKLCGEYNNCCDVLNKIWNKISEVENGNN